MQAQCSLRRSRLSHAALVGDLNRKEAKVRQRMPRQTIAPGYEQSLVQATAAAMQDGFALGGNVGGVRTSAFGLSRGSFGKGRTARLANATLAPTSTHYVYEEFGYLRTWTKPSLARRKGEEARSQLYETTLFNNDVIAPPRKARQEKRDEGDCGRPNPFVFSGVLVMERCRSVGPRGGVTVGALALPALVPAPRTNVANTKLANTTATGAITASAASAASRTQALPAFMQPPAQPHAAVALGGGSSGSWSCPELQPERTEQPTSRAGVGSPQSRTLVVDLPHHSRRSSPDASATAPEQHVETLEHVTPPAALLDT